MNRELLLQHFDRISEAPDAIPRLRRFILDLAVRGKLVEQNPNDEPAAELLKRVSKWQSEAIQRKQIRAPKKNLNAVSKDEMPYLLPKGWEWARLGKILYIQSGDGLTAANMEHGEIPVFGGNGINGYHNIHNVEASTIVIGRVGYYCGSIHLTPSKAWVTDNAFITSYCQVSIYQNFLLLLLSGTNLKERENATAQPVISGSKIYPIVIGMPPLAEQHRIVAKVEELMALCDQLEAERNKRESRRDRLVASSLNCISTNTAEEAKDATRFHLNHLPRLTTRTEHIKQLRNTILNLAVRGRLVPQDPSDEPAAELLKRMQSEKATLEKAGEIKKEKPIKAVMADEIPFDIPSHWRWVRLGELTELITKGSSPKWQGVSYSSKEDGVLFVTSENVGNYCLRKLDEPKYVEKKFNEIEPRSILRYGDILMNLVGASIGRTAVYNLPDIANINQAVALIRLVRKTAISCTSFLLHYLNSPSAIQFMTASQVVTAQPNISLTNARDFPIPFPPIAEQHRIVAKVDELMALCDQMETQLATTGADSRRMLEAVLRDALNPAVMEAA